MLFFASTQLINNVVNNTPGIKNRSSCMYEYLCYYRVAVPAAALLLATIVSVLQRKFGRRN